MTAYTYERSQSARVYSERPRKPALYKITLRTISVYATLFLITAGLVAIKAAVWLPSFNAAQ